MDDKTCPFCGYTTIAIDDTQKECSHCHSVIRFCIDFDDIGLLEKCDGLKDCPICGTSAKLGKYAKQKGFTYWAQCPDCGTSTPNYDVKEAAMIVWNDRIERNN